MNAASPTRDLSFARWVGPMVVVGIAVLCGLTAVRAVLGGDNGEFTTFAARPGLAHPPGFPLYVLYLRMMRWLPAENVAHRAAIATAILGVLATWVMQRAARAWGASAIAAAIASTIYATSRIAWDLATHAEVFTLNALLALAIAWVSAPSIDMKPIRRVALLGLLAGLGISNHPSIVLIAPLGVFGAICAVRSSSRRIVAILAGVGALIVGLLPYAYLLIGSRAGAESGGFVWGDVHDARSLLRHFLRTEYGTFSLGVSKNAIEPLAEEAFLIRHLALGLLGLTVVALGLGVVSLVRSKKRPRGATIAFLAAFLLAGPLFVARFNTPPRGIGGSIVERFHLLPMALASVLSAIAITPWLARLRPTIGVSIAGVAFAIGAFLSFPDVREQHRPTVQIYAENALALLPQNAILVGSGDHRMSAMLYEQIALGKRSDVVFVNPPLLLADWYADQTSKRLGFEIPHAHNGALHGGDVIAVLVASKRPVFLTDWFVEGLDKQFPSYPVGVLIAIVDDPAKVPDPYGLERINVDALHAMTIEDDPPKGIDTWAGDLQRDYARPWEVLAEAFDRMGDGVAAGRARERAQILAP